MMNHSEVQTAMNNQPVLTLRKAIHQSFSTILLATLALGGSMGWLSPQAVAVELPANGSLPDGTYLFGDVPTADTMGRGYVVFTQQSGRVVGALYQPNSDYSCFSGVQQNQQLYITAYSLGDEPWRTQVVLPKMHLIEQVNEVGARTLAACRTEMAQRERNSLTARQDVRQPRLPGNLGK
jgi:hypothetical protein